VLESPCFSVLASTFSPHRDRFMPSPVGPAPTPVQLIGTWDRIVETLGCGRWRRPTGSSGA
jgi:hypothetical protein